MVDILGEFIHDGDAISERVAKLEKLHYTVELLVMLESLDFPQTVLHAAARFVNSS